MAGTPAGSRRRAFPSAVGAALANREHRRLSVNIRGDGDLMYAPGALWTAAHHRIPLPMVMHNNRAYHQEVMHVQRMANRHNRGIDRAHVGTTLTDPDIDFATLARRLGVWSAGPMRDPSEFVRRRVRRSWWSRAAPRRWSTSCRNRGDRDWSDRPSRRARLAASASAWAEDAASAGQKLYVAQGCSECHGGVGQGSSFSGPRLAPEVVTLEAFIVQLRQPAGDRPPYGDKALSDRQITDIIAIVKTVPIPPGVASIALLQ